MKKRFLACLFSACYSLLILAQSDGCAGVPSLTVGATCTTTNFSLPGSFTNNGLVLSSCNATDRDDGWYSFVATSANTQVTATAVTESLVLAIWSSCGGGVQQGCGNAAAGGTVTVNLTTVIGVTYFVQLHRQSGNGAASMTGTICVRNIPPPPINDNCNTATVVPVNSGVTCTTSVSGTIANATASAQANGCSGTADDDVWYSFVATNTSHNINLNNVAGSTIDLYHNVYSGTCGALGTALVCSDPNNSTVTGLTVGATYFVRVFSWTSTAGQTSTFDICITTPPPPPVNDNCNTATSVPVNSGIICTSSVAGTLTSATASSQANGCSGTADDDVWYSFVATNTTHYINLNNVTGSTTDLYHNVYSGTCGALGTALVCSDPNNSTVTGLTVGNTYFVRVFSWTSTAGQTSTFNICIGTPPPPPANDNCGGAINVPVSSGTCSYVTGTIASATASSQANGCSGTADDDVWYSFVATAPSVIINFTNITGSTSDLYHNVYSGTCGAIGTALVCSDPNSSTVTGLTIGNTYYVRVFSWGSTAGETSVFDLCIQAAGPCGTPNNQDYCVAPAVLTQGPGTFSANTSGTYTSDTPANLNSVFCGSIENNSWYEFVATATTHTFDFTAVGGTGCSYGIQAQVYNVTEDVNGCCTNFASVSNCFNPSTVSTGTVTATGLTVGQTYRLMVDGNAGSICDFTVSNWTATGIIALGVTFKDFSAIGSEDGNIIKWETSTEVNNDYFILQRSVDGIEFDAIATIEGQGTKFSPTSYQFMDDLRSNQILYYRLKQVDFNGTNSWSEVLSIHRTHFEKIIVFPNPVQSLLTISLNHKENLQVKIETVEGVLVSEHEMNGSGEESLSIPTDQLRSGIYYIKVEGQEEFFEPQKFIKN